MNYRDLSLIQKGMVMIYKNGLKLPLLESYVAERNVDKIRIQIEYAKLQKKFIGDENAIREYWIARLKLSP